MCNSWLISITQFIFVWVVANGDDPVLTFLFAGLGGSVGCGVGHNFYVKFIYKGEGN